MIKNQKLIKIFKEKGKENIVLLVLILIAITLFNLNISLPQQRLLSTDNNKITYQNSDNLKTSATYAWITVDDTKITNGTDWGNWTWARTQPWCTAGNGTKENPYIIENSIFLSEGGDCLTIQHSRKYFTVRNCTFKDNYYQVLGLKLFNVTNGQIAGNRVQKAWYGIYCFNVNNSKIINNNASNNQYGIRLDDSYDNIITGNIAASNTEDYGIFLANGSNNTVTKNDVNSNGGYGIVIQMNCHNNTVSSNDVYNNYWEGILIRWLCDGNTIINNTVKNNGVTGFDPGISLYDTCDFNNITGNLVRNDGTTYQDQGIKLEIDCDRNRITNNIIIDNQEYGIYLDNGCDNNSIYKSFFLENGKHAIDNGTDNTWNSTTIGSYWDNHTGPDTIPQDGIVDDPYTYIGGSAGTIDYLPIAEDGAPTITINSPSNDELFGMNAPSYNVTITDDYIYEMWYTLDGGLHNYTFTGLTGTINQSAWNATSEGNVTITFYASDIPGNIGSAEDNIEKDTQAPTINITSPTSNDIFGVNVPSFNVRIIDDNLDSMWYSLDGGLHNYTFTANDTIDHSAWNAMADGTIKLHFYTNDTLGHIGSAGVNIEKDAQAPVITINSPSSGREFGVSAPAFIITINDDHLDSIWYTLDGGLTNYAITMNGTIDQTAWASLSEGSIAITFYANDTLGNEAFEEVTVTKSIPASTSRGIPFGNFYLIVVIIGTIGLIVYVKRKL